MKLALFLTAVLVAVLSLPGLATAQPAGGHAAVAQASAADRATARALGHEGEAALAEKDYATAADRYGRAEAIFHAPTLLLGLARAEVGLGKLVDAEEAYRRIVAEGLPPKATPAFVAALESARAELAGVSPRVAWLTITVVGAAGAKVSLDGAALAGAVIGVRRAVDPGRHVVVASAAGGAPKETVVTLGEGMTKVISVDLAPAVVAPVVVPPAPRVVPPVSVLPVKVAPVKGVPETGGAKASRGSPRKAVGIALAAVGGAGIVVGAVAGVLAISERSSLVSGCPSGVCPPGDQGGVSSFHTRATISTVGFIGGAVAGGAGVVLLVTAPKKQPAVGVTLAPYVGLGAVGMAGRF